MTEALTFIESKEVSYTANGEEIRLTGEMIKKYIARGNKAATDAEVMMFMSLCKYQKLNPFLNEAYLVKFGDEAQMIVGKEAFMKRAESSEKLEGHEAGIIVKRGDEIIELQGCFMLPTDVLVGGWAIVYRSDRKHPIVVKVSLKEYDKGQSLWKSKPATMIRKIALVQALKEAFPADVGGMYTEEELGVSAAKNHAVDIEIKNMANKEIINVTPVEVKNISNVTSEKYEPAGGPDF